MFESMMKWSVGLTAVGCVLVIAAAAGADFEYSASRTEGASLFPGGTTRVVVADDGTWLMLRRCKADGSGVDSHAGQVFLAHSIDDGETWVDDGNISNAESENDATNAEFIKYPNGDIEIFYTRYSNRTNTFYTPNMVNRLTYNGTYAGSTWSGFQPAVGPLNEPSSIMWQEVSVGDTTYLGRYGRYSGPTFSKTTDNGLTWTDVSHIDPEAPPGYHSEYGEPGLIHLGNGEFLAVLRGCGDWHDGSSTQGLTLQKRSTDWGQTWTLDGYIKSDGSVNPDKDAGTNVRLDQCRMWTEDINGNDLGYIYLQANLYPGHYPRDMYAYFSTDGGASWGSRSLLEANAHDSALVLKSRSSAKYYPGRMLGEGNITSDNIDIVTPPPIPGDANDDGIVDDEDASILAANWQQMGRGWEHGDFSGDGIVDDEDASILAANWQENQEGAAPVPEPSVLALLLGVGLLGLLAHARRRAPDSPQ